VKRYSLTAVEPPANPASTTSMCCHRAYPPAVVATANDFFPPEDAGQWAFVEKSSLQRPVFTFTAPVGDDGRRAVTLEAPEHRFSGFFDRMAISPEGLELRRLHFTNEILDIPPWLLTLGPDPDRVEDILPAAFDGAFGLIRSPFTGVTTNKVVTDNCWSIDLKVSGNGGDVLEASLRFAAGTGLCAYRGQVYGVFFIYERLDEARCAGCA
jgi:hypothetical protein